MKATVLFILLVPYALNAQVNNLDNYRKEVSVFFTDIFNDTTKYTKYNFKRDSLKVPNNFVTDIEYDRLKKLIDTSSAKYMIRTGERSKINLDTLFIQADFLNYSNFRLKDFLYTDSLLNLEYKNPFRKSEVDSVFELYFQAICDFKPEYFFSNATLIKDCEIDRYYEYKNGWIDLHEKYDFYIEVSLPVFNLQGDFAIIEWSITRGNMNGLGYIGLYEKINGKWCAIKVLNTWIS